jgi:hypothetical protein
MLSRQGGYGRPQRNGDSIDTGKADIGDALGWEDVLSAEVLAGKHKA